MTKKVTLKDIKNISGNWKEKTLNFHILGNISPYLSWLFAKLPFTPNQISFIWIIIGFIGIFIMGLGGYWFLLLGILIYHFAILLDYVDGEIARIRKKTTIGGAYVDMTFSWIFRSLLLLGLGIGIYNTNGNVIYFYLGIWSCLLLVFDNLAKLKVYEALIDEDRLDLIKKQKEIILKDKSFIQKTKIYIIEMLRPFSPFSLIFFAILFNVPHYYLILMAIISPLVFVRSLINIYKEIGNIR